MANSMKFYYDFVCPPSRALYILFKVANVPFEDHQVALRRGAQLGSEFKQINRFQKVPCIVDNNFKLAESVAILRYLHDKGQIPDAWYPNEIHARARVDECMQWQHNNTRAGIGLYLHIKAVGPLKTGKEPSPKLVKFAENYMENALNTIETTWLTDSKFLSGDKINMADLIAACDIEQTRAAGYDAKKGRPKLEAWLKAVKDATDPHFTDAHRYVDNFEKKVGSKL